MQQATTIEELLRLPSPAPLPQALACDGNNLWIGSLETRRIYGIDRAHFTVFEELNAPGKPISLVSTGGELRGILSEGGDDNRFVRRYIPGHGFKDKEKTACPNDTGSFLAFDGECLWLSQRYDKRICHLDVHGSVVTEVKTDAEILGIAWIDEQLYASLWFGENDGGCMIGRLSGDRTRVDAIAAVPFKAISLTHDGTKFWSNDRAANEIVAYAI